ncbi:MAG: hypothetical protein ACHQ9S_27025 [Candidatus Binatia bacterium]
MSWRLTDVDRPRPWSFDTKVEIFGERVDGWQLLIAELCVNGGPNHDGTGHHPPIKHSGFAVLLISLSYFEMVGKYRAGYCKKGDSGKYFKEGVQFAIPDLALVPDKAAVKKFLADLYEKVRCGLYHVAGLGPNVGLTGDIPHVIQYESQQRVLLINPHLLPIVLRTSLGTYRYELSDPANTTLRNNFERRFDFDNP